MDTALDPSRIRALCFDLDGTLSDTDDLFVRRVAYWLRIFRFFFPNRDPLPLARRIVMSTETPGTYLYGLPDRFGLDDEIARLGDHLYRFGIGRSKKPFLLIPGVREMLDALLPHFPMSIVSARGARAANAFVEQFNLAGYFTSIVTAQTCAHTKPYPEPVIFAAHRMGVDAASCLMIGDTTVDILAGKSAGAQTAGVLCGFGVKSELVRAGATAILETTPQLALTLIPN